MGSFYVTRDMVNESVVAILVILACPTSYAAGPYTSLDIELLFAASLAMQYTRVQR